MKIADILHSFKGITVFALVGPSGTGKSFRAKLVAEKYGIDAIIDDGLLIQDDKIVAGQTAKREKTYMGAVRVALFDDKGHRDQVAKALQKKHIKKILLLGTSEKMVQKIAMRLQLPTPSKIINITDVASQEDIETAQRSRLVEGKHVIPVPAIEIKRDYPKIFYNKVKIFFKGLKITDEKDKNSQVSEKSVVRPEFSKKGRIEISEAVITQMVMHCVAEHDSQIRVKKLQIKTNSSGYRLVVTIDIPFGTQLTGTIHNLQSYIINNIEKYTGILIEEVSIIIDKITQTENIQKR